jgi:hypothetical protein
LQKPGDNNLGTHPGARGTLDTSRSGACFEHGGPTQGADGLALDHLGEPLAPLSIRTERVDVRSDQIWCFTDAFAATDTAKLQKLVESIVDGTLTGEMV